MLLQLAFNLLSIRLPMLFARYDDEIFQSFQTRFRNMQVIDEKKLSSGCNLRFFLPNCIG